MLTMYSETWSDDLQTARMPFEPPLLYLLNRIRFIKSLIQIEVDVLLGGMQTTLQPSNDMDVV